MLVGSIEYGYNKEQACQCKEILSWHTQEGENISKYLFALTGKEKGYQHCHHKYKAEVLGLLFSPKRSQHKAQNEHHYEKYAHIGNKGVNQSHHLLRSNGKKTQDKGNDSIQFLVLLKEPRHFQTAIDYCEYKKERYRKC